MNVTIGGIARTVEITSFDKLGDVKVCMLTTTADGSVGFQQLNQEVVDTIYASFPVDTSSGDIASFEDGADNVPVRELKLNMEPYQNLNGYDSPWVGGAGKNKYNPNEAQVGKWINSSTGAIENASGYWVSGFIPVKSDDVIRTTAKGSARNAWYNSDKTQSTYFAYSGGGTGVTAPSDGYVVFTGQTSVIAYDGQFICTINDSDLTYEPYSNICPIYPSNGKNLLPNTDIATLKSINSTGTWNGNSYTRGGVTYTVNSDGSVSTSGTASENTYFYFVAQNTETLANIGLINGNKYTVNGCPSGGSDSTYRVQAQTNWVTSSDTGSGKTFTYSTGGTDTCRIAVQSGTNVEGKVFYPMLRHAEITDSTYVPYNAIGITRTGKNLANFVDGYNVNPDGTVSAYEGRSATVEPIRIDPTKTYRVHGVGNDQLSFIVSVWNGNTLVRRTASVPNNYTIDTSGGTHFYVAGYSGLSSITPSNDELMVLFDDVTDYTYEPYQGERYYPISDNPVYGGTLDVTTGVLTVTRGYGVVDGSESGTWAFNNNTNRQLVYKSIWDKLTDIIRTGGIDSSALFSNFKTVSSSTGVVVGNAYLDNGYINFAMPVNTFADSNAVKTWLASNNIGVRYTLATPQTYQLTPVQVKTLLGYNNIWTDSGTVEVQYLANIGLYIQKIIGATEDDMVANQNISANKYFFVGEELYYSTSAISAGQTIIVGTNCIKTTLADALNALNS